MDSSWSSTSPTARLLTLDETLYPPNSGLGDFRTVVLKRKGDARRFYETVCIPLTTPAWSERWKKLCTTMPEVGIFADAEDLVMEMDEDGETKEQEEDSELEEKRKKRQSVVVKKDEEETEKWRKNPVFRKGEVTMTGLGEYLLAKNLAHMLNALNRRG